jgi:Family of unknown function (DUF6151)
MAGQVEVRCRCGEVRGIVTDPSPQTVNRVICYCDDCQAYAHQLGRADLLNAKGGSDIIQLAPAALSFTKGQDRIAGLRLTPKGLYRWYTRCCNTPVGTPSVPPFRSLASPCNPSMRRGRMIFLAYQGARSSANMPSANRQQARPVSTCRCSCAPSAG